MDHRWRVTKRNSSTSSSKARLTTPSPNSTANLEDQTTRCSWSAASLTIAPMEHLDEDTVSDGEDGLPPLWKILGLRKPEAIGLTLDPGGGGAEKTDKDTPAPPIPTVDPLPRPRSSRACPECQSLLPGRIPSKLSKREKIERCTVCTRKKAELLEEWRDKRYPKINWKKLPRRLEGLELWLRECLQKRETPTFREKYLKARESAPDKRDMCSDPRWLFTGKLRGENTITQFGSGYYGTRDKDVISYSRSGYYGPHGEDIMTWHLMPLLHADLRDAEIHDPDIQSASEYWIMVMMPEAFTELTREDMGQDRPTALQTMEEGASLGLRLHGD